MSYDELARALQELAAQQETTGQGQRAYLHRDPTTGSVAVQGKANMVWVRSELGRERGFAQAFNQAGVKLIPDLPVLVEQRNGVLCVTGYDPSAALTAYDGLPVSGSGVSSGSIDPVEDRRVLPGLVHAYKDPTTGYGIDVSVEPFTYVFEGTGQRFTGGTIDLTAYLPATANHHGWVKVGLDPETNTLVAVAGTTKSAFLALTTSELDGIAFASYIPLAGVKLAYNTTAIDDESYFLSCRPWWSGASQTALDGLRHRLDATAAPSTGDDSADGYGPGSLWLDTSGGALYVCQDATAGAAVWKDLTDTGAAAASAFRYPLQLNASVGGSLTAWSYGSNGWIVPVLAYDQTTEETAFWTLALPSTLPASFSATLTLHWTTTGSSGAVVWEAKTLARADGESLDVAPANTDTFAADAVSAAYDDHVVSTMLSTTGWAAGELLLIRITRKAADGSDTLADDAYLLAATLEIE